MGDLSENFSRSEWHCKCGNCFSPAVDAELIFILQRYVRFFYDKPVKVTPNGGYRCPEWNKECGGAIASQHTQNKAADIKVEGIDPKEVYDHLCRYFPNSYGLGLYKTFVHIDVRSGLPARWIDPEITNG